MKKSKLQRLQEAREREKRKEAGFFDGRFRSRTEPSKKKYKRKVKHKKDEHD